MLVLAEPGTVLLSSQQRVQRPSYQHCTTSAHQYKGFQRLVEQTKWGLSGYDPEHEDMRGIFLARGPGECS